MNKSFQIPLALLMLFSITTLSAQDKEFWPRNQIKFNPIKLVDFVNPGLELGFERFHSNQKSSQLMITWQKEILNVTPFHNYEGWRFAFEEKFFTRYKKNQGRYLGFELAYLNVNYDYVGEFATDTSQNATKYEDSFHIAKQSYSGNFKIGVQVYFNSFVIDLYTGIGLKYKMTRHSGKQDPTHPQVFWIHDFVYRSANYEGNYLLPNIIFSLRICYRF